MKKVFSIFSVFCFMFLLAGCGSSLSRDEALDLALEDAKVKESDITIVSEKEDEDGYTFSFHTDDTLYSYEIEDGKISEKESQVYTAPTPSADDPTTPSNPSSTVNDATNLSEEEAITKACEHFRVNRTDVTNLTIKQEIEDGKQVYDIDFYIGTTEYSCDVEIATGNILSPEMDTD